MWLNEAFLLEKAFKIGSVDGRGTVVDFDLEVWKIIPYAGTEFVPPSAFYGLYLFLPWFSHSWNPKILKLVSYNTRLGDIGNLAESPFLREFQHDHAPFLRSKP